MISKSLIAPFTKEEQFRFNLSKERWSQMTGDQRDEAWRKVMTFRNEPYRKLVKGEPLTEKERTRLAIMDVMNGRTR